MTTNDTKVHEGFLTKALYSFVYLRVLRGERFEAARTT